MGQRLVKSISFLPQKEKIEIRTFNLMGLDKVYEVDFHRVVVNQEEMKWDSTSKHKLVLDNESSRYLSTYGTGLWKNKHLFDFLLVKHDIESD